LTGYHDKDNPNMTPLGIQRTPLGCDLRALRFILPSPQNQWQPLATIKTR
jgi:hypothetical protein